MAAEIVCHLLKPREGGKIDLTPIPNLGVKKTWLLLFTFLQFCHHHENIAELACWRIRQMEQN